MVWPSYIGNRLFSRSLGLVVSSWMCEVIAGSCSWPSIQARTTLPKDGRLDGSLVPWACVSWGWRCWVFLLLCEDALLVEDLILLRLPPTEKYEQGSGIFFTRAVSQMGGRCLSHHHVCLVTVSFTVPSLFVLGLLATSLCARVGWEGRRLEEMGGELERPMVQFESQ